MPEATNVTYQPAQDGHRSIVPSWVDGPLPLSLDTTGINPSAAGGIVFDLNIVAGAGPRMGALTLNVVARQAFPRVQPTVVDLSVLMVPSATPADYSTAALPRNRNEFLVGLVRATLPINAAPIAVSIPLDEPSIAPNGVEAPGINAINRYIGRADWDGRIALTIYETFVSGLTGTALDSLESGTPAQLVASQVPFYSGHSIGNEGTARARMDDRFGFPTSSKDLVGDGFKPGAAVFSWDRDPPDPPSRYRPSPKEGAVDPEPASVDPGRD